MRVYVINIDAAPLFDPFRDHLRRSGFHQADLLVNGMFTTSSIKSMYSGKVYDAIGPNDALLVEMLLDRGVQVELHGAYASFVRDILGETSLVEDTVQGERTRLSDMMSNLSQPEYADLLVSVSTKTTGRFREWGVRERYDEFMRREAVRLAEIQSEDRDALTHVTWGHYHDFVYFDHVDHEDQASKLEYLDGLEKSLIEWIDLFDFDEPEAMFFIFSDHGDYVHRLTPPKDYLRWCFVKDNTDRPVVPSKLTLGIDVFRSVLEKFAIDFDYQGYDSRPLDAPVDHDRIHHMADTRYWDENRSTLKLDLEKLTTREPISMTDVDVCMNATAVRVIDWTDDDAPARLLQATYYRHTRKYYFLLFEPDQNDPVYRYGFFRPSDQEPEVIDSMAGREGLRGHMIELCESLIEQFDWIENQDYRGQLDADDFPEWLVP